MAASVSVSVGSMWTNCEEVPHVEHVPHATSDSRSSRGAARLCRRQMAKVSSVRGVLDRLSLRSWPA